MAEAALADHGTNKGAKNKNAPHPTYMVMVKEAIQALKERNGSSRQKITKYIISNHLDTPDLTKVNHHVTNAIKKAVAEETIIQTKGIGANGSFKLAKSEKQVMAKKTTSAPKEKAPATAKRVAKAKMPAPVVGKTPSKITKKAAVAKKRLSSVGAISAVLQTPRPKARKPKPPVHSPSPVSHIAPNETYTLSLSEESSQDDLPSLEIDEPPKKSKKPAVRKKATPTKKSQAKSKAKTSPKKTTAAKKTTAKKSEPAKGKTTAPATKKGAAAKSDTTAATTKAPAKKAPAKKAPAKKAGAKKK